MAHSKVQTCSGVIFASAASPISALCCYTESSALGLLDSSAPLCGPAYGWGDLADRRSSCCAAARDFSTVSSIGWRRISSNRAASPVGVVTTTALLCGAA
jgi:hypothetical protein